MANHHVTSVQAIRSCGTLATQTAFLSLVVLMAGGCASMGGVSAASEDKQNLWLITPQELEVLEHQPGGVSVRGSICESGRRILGDGPRIELLEPEADRTSVTSPFPVRINLAPRHSPIAAESLKVIARWQLPLVNLVKDLDITDRVRAHMSGGVLEEPKMSSRPGCYQIELSIEDEVGRESVLIHGLRVSRR